MLNRIGKIGGLTFALAACTGPGAGGQSAAGIAPAGVAPNVYRIAPEQVAQEAGPGFIEVSGTGSVSVPPDRASVSFAMETRAAAASDAASANADAMDRVLNAIRGAGFADLELETFGYSLRPEYGTANPRTREIVAYTALNNVSATASAVEEVGRVIDAAVAAGANRVVSISFAASDTDDAQREALAQAVAEARDQAAVIARSLGHALGAPLEVRGGSNRPVPMMATRGMALESVQVAPTPIEAGDQTVTASVTIRFALGPELGG